MKKISVILGLITLVLLVFPQSLKVSAAGNIYYISTTGNDVTGDGSFGNPWATFDQGISVLTAGDTLRAFGGTYNEQVTVSSGTSGTAGNEITIESVSGQTAIVKYSTNLGQSFRVYGNYITLKNIEIDGSDASYSGVQCLLVRPPTTATADQTNITIDNLVVHGCGSHGVDVGGRYNGNTYESTNVIVQNTEIYEAAMNNDGEMASGWGSGLKVSRDANGVILSNNTVRDSWGEGIAVTRGKNVEVTENTTYNNFSVNIYIDNSLNVNVERNFAYCIDGDGAILKGGNKAVGISTAEEYYGDAPLWGNQMANISIVNNIVYNCRRGFAYWGVDSGTGGMVNSIIANNTFYMTDTDTSMIYINYELENDIAVYNNIFRANPAQNKFVFFDSTSAGTYDFHNNYWVYETGSPSSIVSGAGDVEGNLASVSFVTAAGFDPSNFAINSNSLAVNAGSVSPVAITTDYAGNLRQNPPDIGAYEYIPAATGLDGLFGYVHEQADEAELGELVNGTKSTSIYQIARQLALTVKQQVND